MDNPEHKYIYVQDYAFPEKFCAVTSFWCYTSVTERIDDNINTYTRDIYFTTEGKEMQ